MELLFKGFLLLSCTVAALLATAVEYEYYDDHQNATADAEHSKQKPQKPKPNGQKVEQKPEAQKNHDDHDHEDDLEPMDHVAPRLIEMPLSHDDKGHYDSKDILGQLLNAAAIPNHLGSAPMLLQLPGTDSEESSEEEDYPDIQMVAGLPGAPGIYVLDANDMPITMDRPLELLAPAGAGAYGAPGGFMAGGFPGFAQMDNLNVGGPLGALTLANLLNGLGAGTAGHLPTVVAPSAPQPIIIEMKDQHKPGAANQNKDDEDYDDSQELLGGGHTVVFSVVETSTGSSGLVQHSSSSNNADILDSVRSMMNSFLKGVLGVTIGPNGHHVTNDDDDDDETDEVNHQKPADMTPPQCNILYTTINESCPKRGSSESCASSTWEAVFVFSSEHIGLKEVQFEQEGGQVNWKLSEGNITGVTGDNVSALARGNCCVTKASLSIIDKYEMVTRCFIEIGRHGVLLQGSTSGGWSRPDLVFQGIMCTLCIAAALALALVWFNQRKKDYHLTTKSCDKQQLISSSVPISLAPNGSTVEERYEASLP